VTFKGFDLLPSYSFLDPDAQRQGLEKGGRVQFRARVEAMTSFIPYSLFDPDAQRQGLEKGRRAQFRAKNSCRGDE
jgi:hypothetical protein